MEFSNSSYKLDNQEFSQALSVLNEEEKLIPLTKFNKISYFLLSFCTYGFIIINIFTTILVFYVGYWRPDFWVNYVLLGFSVLLLISIPIIFFLNLPLVKKIFQQNYLSRKIGHTKLFNERWRALRKKRRFRNILTFIAGIIGLLYIWSGIYINFMADPGERSESLIFLVMCIIIGGVLISTHFIRRGKERLDVLTKTLLDAQKTALQTDADQIDVPSKEYELIAQIERAQVSRSRQQSILNSLEKSKSQKYYIQKSYRVKEALSQIDINLRSFIEDRINDLITEPVPMDAIRDKDSNMYRISLSKLNVNIGYQVDNENNLIKILSLNILDRFPEAYKEKGEM